MKILCNYGAQDIPASLQVNRIGKFIYKHLTDAYKLDKSENMNDVYFTILYELKPEYGGTPNDVQEMDICVSITTYQNKIRVNVIRMDDGEKTLMHKTYKPEDLVDLHRAFDLIMHDIEGSVRQEYRECNILFDTETHKRP